MTDERINGLTAAEIRHKARLRPYVTIWSCATVLALLDALEDARGEVERLTGEPIRVVSTGGACQCCGQPEGSMCSCSRTVARAQTAEQDRDRLQAEVERLTLRRFPIQQGPSLPWAMIAPHEAQAVENHGQSLERLAERGGLACAEALCVIDGKPLNGVRKYKGFARDEIERRRVNFESAEAHVKELEEVVAKVRKEHACIIEDGNYSNYIRDCLEDIEIATRNEASDESSRPTSLQDHKLEKVRGDVEKQLRKHGLIRPKQGDEASDE